MDTVELGIEKGHSKVPEAAGEIANTVDKKIGKRLTELESREWTQGKR
jgi:hypothetical protein